MTEDNGYVCFNSLKNKSSVAFHYVIERVRELKWMERREERRVSKEKRTMWGKLIFVGAKVLQLSAVMEWRG